MDSNKSLQGKRVAILLSDDFEQVEMTEPRKALQEAGATTVLISPKPGQVQGFNHDKPADKFPVDMTLEQASPDQFDGVLLPGGALNADFLRMEKKAQDFVRQIDQAGKPIAVICHAPWLLVSAGLVKGRQMTSYKTIQDDLRNAGANWVDQEAVRDGNWVSSRQPDDIPAFNRQMLALFSEQRPQQGQRSPETAYSSESMLASNNPSQHPQPQEYRGPDDLLITEGQTGQQTDVRRNNLNPPSEGQYAADQTGGQPDYDPTI